MCNWRRVQVTLLFEKEKSNEQIDEQTKGVVFVSDAFLIALMLTGMLTVVRTCSRNRQHGNPKDLKVIRPLGLGLDQKAIEAVEKWKFSPGKKDGRAVPVQATIEVNFRLL